VAVSCKRKRVYSVLTADFTAVLSLRFYERLSVTLQTEQTGKPDRESDTYRLNPGVLVDMVENKSKHCSEHNSHNHISRIMKSGDDPGEHHQNSECAYYGCEVSVFWKQQRRDQRRSGKNGVPGRK